MNQSDTYSLRALLEALPTGKLEQMLEEELEKDPSDPAQVRLLLSVLEDRDMAAPRQKTAAHEQARRRYRQRMAELFPQNPRKRWMPLLRVASVLLVLGLMLVMVPQRAEAETFWQMLQRLSSTVVQYLERDATLVKRAYAFDTDNEGLQKVYDAVVALGVTDPVVPMWIPEDYVLLDIQNEKSPMMVGLWATFSNGDNEVVYKLDIYEGEPAHQYYRDDTHYDSYERNGATYMITRNNDYWIVVWTKDNMEASIAVNCQEDTLRRILKSIYVMEE